MPNTIHLGFGNSSDAYFIFESNKRYNLEDFNYKYVDVKDIYNWYSKTKKHYSLQAIADKFKLNWCQHHESLDDAIVTSMVLQKMMILSGEEDLEDFAYYCKATYEVVNGTIYHDGAVVDKKVYKDMLIED